MTLSGGEPLLQADFSLALLNALSGKIHRAVETSGYGASEVFERMIHACDFVFMDLKLYDRAAHRAYTGVSNERILTNARILKESGIPHRFRIPLIPGLTDTEENLRELARVAGDSEVELLSYNRLAPAKYPSVGRVFTDRIRGDQTPEAHLELFSNAILRR